MIKAFNFSGLLNNYLTYQAKDKDTSNRKEDF